MKKFLVLLIIALYSYIAYPYHLIGNYQAPPKSQNNPSLPGFVVNPQDAFLLKPVTLNVRDAPISQVLSYLSGITQV
ncbi:MAG: Type II secretory pathway component PulD-like protein, partial [Hydrogenobaculum sp.]